MTHQHIIGYTVSYALDDLHTQKKIKKTVDRQQKLSTTPKKQTTQNTAQQNYPGSVDFYHTRPGNEVGLFYSSRAHTGQRQIKRDKQTWTDRQRDRQRDRQKHNVTSWWSVWFRKRFNRHRCTTLQHNTTLQQGPTRLTAHAGIVQQVLPPLNQLIRSSQRSIS